jgi:hypothetical protein
MFCHNNSPGNCSSSSGVGWAAARAASSTAQSTRWTSRLMSAEWLVAVASVPQLYPQACDDSLPASARTVSAPRDFFCLSDKEQRAMGAASTRRPPCACARHPKATLQQSQPDPNNDWDEMRKSTCSESSQPWMGEGRPRRKLDAT